ncbi:hypothetical protein KUCAC02_005722 [Chaenocephalus aceratus]|uniref:Uncharacterized protein n=1 Tax=Chaenocephalus aceratus TaxID=36190 RepID=A0ACB9WQY4_CHAAC|nr:hypothetical protein KUCAC02_005722 [Chaenocephalus aceratus]
MQALLTRGRVVHVMQQQIQRMKMFFNTSLTELEQELTKTKNILNDIRVSINLGDSYSTETGIFTVPRSRVYSLALTVYSDAGAPGNTLAACASLQVNGLVVAGSKDRNMQDQEDSATSCGPPPECWGQGGCQPAHWMFPLR